MFHSCKDYHGGGYYQSVAIFNILNEKNMKYFEVGQKVCDVRRGEGQVKEISDGGYYPVLVQFSKIQEWYTTDGRVMTDTPIRLFLSNSLLNKIKS